jgi:hypothetical protein
MLQRNRPARRSCKKLQHASQDRIRPKHNSQRLDRWCSRACVDIVEKVKNALFALFFLVGAVGAQASNLDTLKAAAKRYVAAMETALGLSEPSSCPQIIAVANEYAKAKIAYYCAARAAMPTLLQSARGESSGTVDEQELIEIFRGFGEDQDEEASAVLENNLAACPGSDERDKAFAAIDSARQVAEKFLKDFGQMEGV